MAKTSIQKFLSRILAPSLTLFALLLFAQDASAYWTSEWVPTSSNKIFYAAENQPVCRWTNGGFVGNAVLTKNGNLSQWSCGNKTGADIRLLHGDKGYKLINYRKSTDWVPAHTLLLNGGDGLCIANVSIGNQKIAGLVKRSNPTQCVIRMMGTEVALDSFSYIVTRQDGVTHENRWWNANSYPAFPLSAMRLPSGDYLCRASYRGQEWFGQTFSGQPPGKRAGRYCKITRLSGNQAVVTYISGYNDIYLNSKPSKSNAIYLSTSGSSWLTLDGNGMCRRTIDGAIGVRVFGSGGGCRFPGATVGTVKYLYKR